MTKLEISKYWGSRTDIIVDIKDTGFDIIGPMSEELQLDRVKIERNSHTTILN